MANDPALTHELPSPDDLKLFFTTRHPNLTCPVCGAEEFEIEVAQVASTAVTCLSCAHILLFSSSRILEQIARIKQGADG